MEADQRNTIKSNTSNIRFKVFYRSSTLLLYEYYFKKRHKLSNTLKDWEGLYLNSDDKNLKNLSVNNR
jgi:hypothetical protein